MPESKASWRSLSQAIDTTAIRIMSDLPMSEV